MTYNSPLSRADLKVMADAIRILAVDAVEKAASGHQGMPMGMADAATVLFTQFLKFDPAAPDWPDRDRFVLSAGHGSMLIYALLYLTGTKGVGLDDIKAFRQLGSSTPGHPEFGHTPGVETTTGPLGQGIATAVGMALAERHLANVFGADLVDHFTYVLASDGDLMEGVSHEAAALAGHLRLNRLIVLFDDNGISIDGPTSLTESTDHVARFAAYGWHAERIDGHDPAAVAAALQRAKAADRPSLIACKTQIGFGSPNKAGTAAIHGFAVKGADTEAVRKSLSWTAPPFEIPPDILGRWRQSAARGSKARSDWETRLRASASAGEFRRRIAGDIPGAVHAALRAHKKALIEKPEAVATRKASEMALEAINAVLPDTIGGSADLTGSNNTKTKTQSPIAAGSHGGRYVYFGVREHGMAAALNGLALHGGVIPYAGTFLVFTDYMRPAMRLSALMGQRVIYVMTHDSIGLGEDGPTHQPVEHLASLRAMPNMLVLRPADAIETAECWELALENRKGPSVIALSRQNLSQVRLTPAEENLSRRGGYLLRGTSRGRARVTLIASGSEVEIALAGQKLLEAEGIGAAVVSMPSLDLFNREAEDYRTSVIDPASLRIAIEAGVVQGWESLIGPEGAFIGMTSFGASAPYQNLYQHFGLTAEAILKAAKARL